MKKKIIYTFLMLFMGINAFADSTDDKFTIGDVTVNPGGDVVTITMSLDNSAAYTSFGVDIYLPEGCEFTKVENDDEDLVYTLKGQACKSDHSISSSLQSDGALRVTSLSLSSASYKSAKHDIFTFYVKANSWTKIGSNSINLKGGYFTTPEAVQYDAADYTVDFNVSTACTLPIPAGWSTCVFPFTPASLSGIKVYDIAGVDGTTVKLKEATSIGDYKPYIVKADAETSLEGTIEATYPTGVKTNGLLNGVVTATEITSDYVLQNQGEGEGFYKVNSEKAITVPMGKAYLSASASPAKDNVLLIEVPTAINNVEAAADNDNVYNLNGVKVSTPQRGIYIKGGKKVVMK